MPLTAAERLSYAVHCPGCGQSTDKAVAWLVAHDHLACAGCGVVINLLTAENAALIKKLIDYAADLDGAPSKTD